MFEATSIAGEDLLTGFDRPGGHQVTYLVKADISLTFRSMPDISGLVTEARIPRIDVAIATKADGVKAWEGWTALVVTCVPEKERSERESLSTESNDSLAGLKGTGGEQTRAATWGGRLLDNEVWVGGGGIGWRRGQERG